MGTLGSVPTIASDSGGLRAARGSLNGPTNYQLYVFWKGSSNASLYEAYFDRKLCSGTARSISGWGHWASTRPAAGERRLG